MAQGSTLREEGKTSVVGDEMTATDALFDRKLRGVGIFFGLLVFANVLFIGWFQLRVGIWGAYEGQIQRPVFLCAFLFLVFMYPLFREKSITFVTVLKNILPAILTLVVLYYYMSHYGEMIFRMGIAETPDLFYGSILILLVLEATRRTAGIWIVGITVVFILYAFFGNYFPGQLYHHGFSMTRVIGLHLTTVDGLFGVPMGVASTFLVLFILFGSTLSHCGAVDYFLDIANSMVGKYNAGPAKLAVVASAMQGTYTGSAVANVVGTGSITIPLMKKVGYDPDFAAAVESAASTGGQIMPPIMGAAAFIMADFLGVPYLTVAKAALIPAFLYFLAVYIIVDLEGRKVGLLPVGDVPKFKKVILEGGHLLIPIFLLIWMLGAGFSMMRAGFVLFISTLVICFLKKGTRVSPRKLFNILETGFKDACSVVMICATAGLIIGSIMMTGLGLKISQLVLAMAAGHLWLALMFTMVVALIMGMGMPSVAVYVVLSALLGHGLSVLGTSLLAAHLFMFYFGVISGITPPVAVSAYAGAAIAKSDPWKTGWTAFRFALSGFIVPFCFIYGPPLLMQGSWLQIMQATVTAGLGVFALSVAVEGWFLTSLRNWPVRATLMGAAILMLHTGGNSDLIGISILAVIICFQIMRANKWKGLRKRMRILVFRNSKP